MPLYEIQHSFPLTRQLKAELASQITHLHATTFATPSFFVNVNFTNIDASAESYFIAGKARPNGCNRITGMVRTSDKRTKKDFDNLAEKIEGIWNQVVRGIEPHSEASPKSGEEAPKEKEKTKGQREETEKEREAKRLHAVFLYPMVAVRERGMVIPAAGEEAQWLQSNMSEFKDRAEAKGDEAFVQLLEEIETRDDLKKLLK